MGITVTPQDLDATIAWYSRNLGFTVDERFESHGTTFVYLTAGDVKVGLLAGASQRNGAPTDNVLASMDPSRLHYFCIAVADLDAAVARLLELDVPLIGGPMEIPDTEQRIVFITDNVGTIIEVTEPGALARWPERPCVMPTRAALTAAGDAEQVPWQHAEVASPLLDHPVPVIAAKDIPYISHASARSFRIIRGTSPRRSTAASLFWAIRRQRSRSPGASATTPGRCRSRRSAASCGMSLY